MTENPPSQMLVSLLIGLDLGDRPTFQNAVWPTFSSQMPDGPNVSDEAIAIIDTPGVLQGRYMSGTVVEKEGCQIRVRSNDFEKARTKARAIATAFDEVNRDEVTVGESSVYLLENVSRQSAPVFIGYDKNKRPEFSINVLVTASTVGS